MKYVQIFFFFVIRKVLANLCLWVTIEKGISNGNLRAILDAIHHKSIGCPKSLSFQARMLATRAIKATLFSPIFFSFLHNFMTLVGIFFILFYQYYIFAVLDKNLVSCVTFKKLTRRMILRVTPPSARPPACSPCWSLPGQAVKRAVPSGRRSRRDGSV